MLLTFSSELTGCPYSIADLLKPIYIYSSQRQMPHSFWKKLLINCSLTISTNSKSSFSAFLGYYNTFVAPGFSETFSTVVWNIFLLVAHKQGEKCMHRRGLQTHCGTLKTMATDSFLSCTYTLPFFPENI